MMSDLEDNTFKISVPIITNEELKRFEYSLETDLDNIVNEISTHISRDREIILLKKVIEKQQKEIEELKEKIKTFKIEDENIYLQFGEITEKKRWQDKIKAKIEELEKQDKENKLSHNYLVIPVLQSLLEKE